MFDQSIRSLVKKQFERIVDEVQKKYDQEIDRIDREAETKKMVAREDAVESIMSKFR